jgi:hypothetical protein
MKVIFLQLEPVKLFLAVISHFNRDYFDCFSDSQSADQLDCVLKGAKHFKKCKTVFVQ